MNRCSHGVWLADHCYQCEKEGVYEQTTDADLENTQKDAAKWKRIALRLARAIEYSEPRCANDYTYDMPVSTRKLVDKLLASTKKSSRRR